MTDSIILDTAQPQGSNNSGGQGDASRFSLDESRASLDLDAMVNLNDELDKFFEFEGEKDDEVRHTHTKKKKQLPLIKWLIFNFWCNKNKNKNNHLNRLFSKLFNSTTAMFM